MLLSSQARLIDNEKMRQQFVGLERRVHPSGRESVDDSGAASANDDLANVCAGAMVLAAAPEFKPAMAVFGIYSGNVDNELGYCGQGEDNRSVYASQPPEYWAARGIFHPAIAAVDRPRRLQTRRMKHGSTNSSTLTSHRRDDGCVK